MTDDEIDKIVARALEETLRGFTKVASDLIYSDPPRWSSRPCSTCQSVSSIIGQDFGCNRYRKENS